MSHSKLTEVHKAILAYEAAGMHREAASMHVAFLRAAEKLKKSKLDKKTKKELCDIAETIDHCGDYGDAYFNPDTGVLFWILADGDGPPDHTSFEEIRKRFLKHPAVKSVDGDAEVGGFKGNPEWVHIDYDRSKAKDRRKAEEARREATRKQEDKERSAKRKLVIEFDCTKEQAARFADFFNAVEYLGQIGSSRDVSIHVDGDGSERYAPTVLYDGQPFKGDGDKSHYISE